MNELIYSMLMGVYFIDGMLYASIIHMALKFAGGR